MIDFSAIQATTDRKQKDSLASYRIGKVLRNGDFQAKNQFDDNFLLSHTNRARSHILYDFGQSNIIQAIQRIEDHNQMYQVFPLEMKLTWIGEIISKNKSEIYCVTILNSAIKHIIKPLIDSNMPNPEKYLSIDNIWIQDNAIFLFLKNKGNSKNLLKTQNTKPNKRFYKMTQGKKGNQMGIIKKFGEIFWTIFYKNQDEKSSIKRQIFKEIINSMRKGQLTFQELQNMMNQKRAIKKFMSAKKNLHNTPRRILYDPHDQNQKCKETIQNIYERLENIPINMGRPTNGMLFTNNKKYKAQTISIDQKQKRVDKNLLFSSIQSDVPPSFSKGRRFKKMSIFCDSRSVSRRYSQNTRYDENNQNTLGKSMLRRYDDTNKNFSFAKDSTPSKLFNPQIGYLSRKKKSVKIKEILDEMMMSKEAVSLSKLDQLNEKSKEKALKKIQKLKQSISVQKSDSQQKIDDEKFRSALKQKKNQYAQQMNSIFLKAQELYQNSKKKVRINSTINTDKFNNWQKVAQKSMIAIKPQAIRQPKHVQSFIQTKIQNQDLFIDNNANKKNEVALSQEKLFESRYQASSDGDKSKIIDSSTKNQKNKGKKNRFDDEYFGETAQKQFGKSSLSMIPQQKPKPKINTVREKTMSSNEDFEMNLPQKSKIQVAKQPQKTQSEVELPSFGHFQSKIQPNVPVKPKQISTFQPLIQKKQKKQPQVVEKIIKQQLPKISEPSQNKTQNKIKLETPIKALTNPSQNFYEKVQQNLLEQAPSPQQYVYTSKISAPKPSEIQEPQKQRQKQISLPKPPVKKDKPKIKSSVAKYGNFDDQIEEINLGVKQQKPSTQKQPTQPIVEKKPTVQSVIRQNTTKTQERQKESPKNQPKEESIKARQKTNQSNASSNGQRTVKKQIDQYIFMINKMGEAVAKTAKLSKKLDRIQWYVGVYFLYKRFYFERKKIQKYLEESVPKLTRYEQFSPQEWNEWLSKGDRETLLIKCKQDNINIENSLKKMVKKVQIKQLPSRVLLNANINKNNYQCTKIAVEYVVDEYDQAIELNLHNDPQIMVHLCQMINALYVIAQLDGKIAEKRKIIEYTRLNRTKEELDQIVQTIFDLYQQQ